MAAPSIKENKVQTSSTLQRTVCHSYVARQECFK
jgi:hypothetical protein